MTELDRGVRRTFAQEDLRAACRLLERAGASLDLTDPDLAPMTAEANQAVAAVRQLLHERTRSSA